MDYNTSFLEFLDEYRVAALGEREAKRIRELEDELNVTLIAYDKKQSQK